MLYGLLCRHEDRSLQEMMIFANRLAGYKVTREGFEGLGEAMEEYI